MGQSGAYDSNRQHLGRDAAVGGAAGGTPIYDSMSSGNTGPGVGQQHRQHHDGVAYHDGGLNKLHKNPPASHPAAQGGVMNDGTNIEPVTGRPVQGGRIDNADYTGY